MSLFSPPNGYNLTTARRLEHSAWAGVAITGQQLVVADGRLLFWNNLSTLNNGRAPDGFVGGTSISDLSPLFGQIKVDAAGRIWAGQGQGNRVVVYAGPLVAGASPLATISSSLPLAGGGSINLTEIHGIAISADAKYLWISQPSRHHVLRVRNPLTAPLIDVVLGQTILSNEQCNRGLVPAPNTGTSLVAARDMLCFPGALSFDRQGNLYVSDHTIEAAGNFRLLMFAATMFPTAPAATIFAPSATKEFPRRLGSNTYSHATFEAAFDSTNRMVVGQNPYLGPRFLEFYDNPTQVNSNNPSDPTLAQPTGKFNDFYNWPITMTFDDADNLYAYDANRGQVRVYRQPFK